MRPELPAKPRPLSVAQMNGWIEELQAQRDGALQRCAILAGERAEVLDLLRHSEAERARLAAIVEAGVLPPSDPAPGTTPN